MVCPRRLSFSQFVVLMSTSNCENDSLLGQTIPYPEPSQFFEYQGFFYSPFRMDTKNKVIISLREVILGLLQFLHPVPDLLVDLRLMEMVPNDSHKHRDRHQKQPSSMFRTKVTISLQEVILGLLQPLHPVLDLQINMRIVKMVPNDFPYTKT